MTAGVYSLKRTTGITIYRKLKDTDPSGKQRKPNDRPTHPTSFSRFFFQSSVGKIVQQIFQNHEIKGVMKIFCAGYKTHHFTVSSLQMWHTVLN